MPEFPRLPEYYRFKEVPWQLFAGLTFKAQDTALKLGRMIFFAWIRSLAKARRVHFQRVLWVYRMEDGSSGEHWHYHALVAGLGILPPGFVRLADSAWRQFSGAHSEIRVFDPRRDGAGYVLKEPAGYNQSQRLRDDVLFIPMPSESVIAYLRKRTR